MEQQVPFDEKKMLFVKQEIESLSAELHPFFRGLRMVSTQPLWMRLLPRQLYRIL